MVDNIYFFPYSWHIKEEEIHVYGFQDNGETTLLRIQEFTPYIYVKLPLHIDWNQTNLSRLINYFKKNTKGNPSAIQKSILMHKRPLYYANIRFENDKPKYNNHPYLFVAFSSEKERKFFTFNMRKKQNIPGLGYLDLEIYEHNATPVLQLTCIRDISTADWCLVKNVRKSQETISKLEHEYSVHWKCLCPLPEDKIIDYIPQPLIMSYDIESFFHDPNKFSDGTHMNDIVFQISCIFGRQSEPKEKWEKYLLTLGVPDMSFLSDVKVRSYKKEFQLLMGFNDLINEKNPQILIGYNIFKFDIPFLMNRAINTRIQDDFVRHGCTSEKCKVEKIKWSSSAYSNQEMNFIDLQGRITIDLLTLIQRDYNLENYKLDSVAEKFLKSNKDPLNHYDIFMCYEIGMKETNLHGKSKSLGLVGKYCIKDSVLVLELFEKLQYWYSLTEMAKICQVPHSHLFLYGQQLKVFSQVYKYCYKNNIVVESGRFKPAEDDFCAGAYVFTPEPGLYDNVVSFDFQSLYPSIIISHNIDFTTMIEDDDKSIPDEFKSTIEWEEHINCNCPSATITKDKDYRCKKYRFHWLKNPIGVLPTIIKNLLDARKSVRAKMKSLDSNSMMYDILNKRQLAYKVSSNSMYGALSTKKGYLPFLPGGMCVTAIGRQSIERVSRIIEKEHEGKVIYGDTDSNYVVFPNLHSLKDIWKHSIKVSEEVSKYFPEPMKLEFEQNVYTRYLILSKKRYLYFAADSEGKISNKIENKGVLLKRRDNSKIIRLIYEDMIRMILNRTSETEVIEKLLWHLQYLYTRNPNVEDFQMSKSVKSISDFHISFRDAKTLQYGDYVVPRLKETPEEQKKQLSEKNASTPEQFYQSHLPGAVQLALRMRARGQHIESGARLSYVVTRRANHKSGVSERMEEIDYFKLHYGKNMIDILHYLHLLINPIEEVLVVMYGSKKYKNFIKDIYSYRIKYDNVVNQLYHICNGITFDIPKVTKPRISKLKQKSIMDYTDKVI
jgi:DNA polymerase elongation subunit (family B)